MRLRGINIQQVLLGIALLAALLWNLAYSSEIKDLRLSTGATGTRVEIHLDDRAEHKVLSLANPDRLVVDLPGSRFAAGLRLPPAAGIVSSVRNGQPVPGTARIVFDLSSPVVAMQPRYEDGPDGLRLILEWPGDGPADPIAQIAAATSPLASAATSPASSQIDPAVASADATSRIIAGLQGGATAVGDTPSNPASPPQPQPSSDPSLQRQVPTPTPAPATVAAATTPATIPPQVAQPPPPAARPPLAQAGTRPLVIAIDPGHGGQDPGAIGPAGTYEKHIVLAISRELARQINATPGMRAYLVRDRDEFVDLPQRARRARQAGADMFVSIHADAAHNRAAYGSSVYTLSTRGASSQQARWLADRENASDLVGGARLERDVLSNVLLDLAQSGHMKASQEAASHVLEGLRSVGKTHKPQVEYANFSVLRNADMPAMLVETGFISNADEEQRLKDPAHQRRLAEAVLKGIDRYFVNQPPPGTLYAARAAREAEAVAGGSR
ncbi:N-acetylmuramoyl-L-alanine amidase [Luteimonas aestuarii]|uniref:N-acetylmuramoyl-L-alanine amidase AmiC n=1 Tax=Luteimonas aestuarii TaxID=453837 RepID=A0A4R5U4A7_9GAMM|nr:N-acetylmuramoyl-L-alanine amidase [Luteimonas aestuarii]TDK28474.1 N-acetylmuramoyl-L-alanine amidase [Luteimonas aestuarii]